MFYAIIPIKMQTVIGNLNTTMLVSHGTETRGGYVRTQVVLSEEAIDSPVVEKPDIFCAMSKAAYQKFYKMSGDNGVILYDPAYVEPEEGIGVPQIAVPARKLSAEKLGKELFANMIMYGYIIRYLGGKIEKEKALCAMRQRIPALLEKNQQAFEIGFQFIP